MGIEFDAMLIEFVAQYITDAFECRGGQPLTDGAIVMKHAKTDFGKCERNTFDRIDTVTELGWFCAKEFASCRYGVKEVFDLYGRTLCASCGDGCPGTSDRGTAAVEPLIVKSHPEGPAMQYAPMVYRLPEPGVRRGSL